MDVKVCLYTYVCVCVCLHVYRAGVHSDGPSQQSFLGKQDINQLMESLGIVEKGSSV